MSRILTVLAIAVAFLSPARASNPGVLLRDGGELHGRATVRRRAKRRGHEREGSGGVAGV